VKVLSLFSGIGATEIAMAGFNGWETVGFCEIEEYPVSILKKRFPGIPVFPDVTKLRGEDVGPVDLICGGFPCQDLSVAGKQRGLFDENGNPTRSGLWFQMLRLVHEIRPFWVLAENVRGSINKALDAVQSSLGEEGYEVRTVCIPASAVGAPHKRERVFVIGIRQDVADRACQRIQRLWAEGVQGSEVQTGKRVSGCNGSGSDGMMWPTPRANKVIPTNEQAIARIEKTGYHANGLGIEAARKLYAGNGGQLNPDWVEILMGFPVGWTDIECDEPEPWPGWPAPMGARLSGQYPYEPPRTCAKMPNRAKRLKALGNSNPPQQYVPALMFIEMMREVMADQWGQLPISQYRCSCFVNHAISR
jgi:DNA (cytosine-5)-methyltransferase 1